MKVIYSSIIPFKSFVAINIFGILFVRREYRNRLSSTLYRHEKIHTAQMKELLFLPFYALYFVEWIVRLFQYRFRLDEAYRAISFEEEAYEHEGESDYLRKRKPFSQWRRNK